MVPVMNCHLCLVTMSCNGYFGNFISEDLRLSRIVVHQGFYTAVVLIFFLMLWLIIFPGSLTSCDSFLNVFQGKGLKPEAVCPCASSTEALTVSIRRSDITVITYFDTDT